VLRDWLWNRARSFVFSTGLAPASAAAAERSLGELIARPELAGRVRELASRLRSGLVAAGAEAAPHGNIALEEGDSRLFVLGFGHVVPVLVGTTARALALAADLRERGIHVLAIRPPTVPVGRARLRFTVTAEHRPSDIDRAIEAFTLAVRTPRHDGLGS
jgi:7-keto-8-aminopelargonate synthetase-like enzyme